MKRILNEDLIKIIVSIILLIAGIFLKNNILLIISYIFVAMEIYINAFKNLKKGNIFDENFLMIVATLGAFYIGEFHEAVFVMLLFSVGEYLSDLAVESSKCAITDLMDLRSDMINLKGIGVTDVKKANIGDIFIVSPGEKIALDGTIINGESHLDTSSLTGEAKPCFVFSGKSVLSGCINLEGVLEVKATSNYKTSTTSKILEILENSDDKKASAENFIARFSKIYTPIVVLLAILVVLVPTLLGFDFSIWLYRALEVLVISCPCALVISIPLCYFSGIGKCSLEKILVKGSNILDDLACIDIILFDKTGTITEGTFEVVKIYSVNKDNNELLKYAALCEQMSTHPIGMSIKKTYGKKINEKISDIKEVGGKGICSIANKDKITIGNKDFLSEMGVDFEKCMEEGTVVYVAKNNEYLGYIIISDKIKKDAKNTINELRGLGLNNLVILSGDDKSVVQSVSKIVNVDKFYASLLPQDKVKILNKYKNEGKVAFVGDGINDAPVLKIADVGISMGKLGSDAAIEASDVVLMEDDLEKIIDAIKISRLTRRVVLFNICFAIFFKIVMLILALFGITPIWLAVFADVGVTLLSVLNSLSIFKSS